MTVKFNHYWTIIHDKSDEYQKFIIKKFIPGVNQLGMHTVACWTVLVGAYSEIVFESVSNDLESVERALQEKKYRTLKTELLNYVKGYKTKVLVKTGKKDTYSVDMREDTVKYNQVWDIKSDKKKEYGRYTSEEYYPILEEAGILIAREWEVLIGDGPTIVCEGRATDINNLIRNLQSRKVQRAKKKLKEYVENYRNRILTYHIQKVKGYKSASYQLIDG